jgi:hypothetical protein
MVLQFRHDADVGEGRVARRVEHIVSALDLRFELRHTLVETGGIERLLEHLHLAERETTALGTGCDWGVSSTT